MKNGMLCALVMTLLTSCFGRGVQQVQRLERAYGRPLDEIIAVERPKQIAERRKSGERIEMEGEAAEPTTVRQDAVRQEPHPTWQ